jgi:phytoene desaturase
MLKKADLKEGGASTAVVIGSGFGGLAAAIRLSCKGYKVIVLEKLDAPGGRAYVHRRDGYTFDAGPTIITAPFLLNELWELCGKKMSDDVDLRLMDPFYRIRFDDGTHFDYTGDPARMRDEVAKFAPEDLPGYERFLAEAEKCYKLGFQELSSTAFDSIGDLIRAIPSMIKMRAWESIYKLVARHLKNDKIRQVMSFHPLLIGGNPFSVTAVYALINSLERRHGVHSAMGGTGSLIKGLAGLLASRGVEIRLNSEVKRIEVEDGKSQGVTLANGEFIASDIVVSNADAAWTYQKLIAPEHRKVWTDAKVNKSKYSMSLFVWYFGTDKQYPDVPHHMILLGKRYKELLTDIFKKHVLADDFSLYLHRPTATDPSLAPAGGDAFYVLAPVPNLESGTDWAKETEPYRQAIAKYLDESVLPGFEKHLKTSFCMTPQDFQDRLLSVKGAAFGFEPLLLQSAWFRPHNRSEDVKGLYMVGAGTHPGAGIPGVLSSAKALMSVVDEPRKVMV